MTFKNLNFGICRLDPGQFSAPYHFHRYSEELFFIISGSATLRTPGSTEVVTAGELIFFETDETGAHQLYNHTEEECVYLDVRTYMGHDICEYPDSNKILIAPSMTVFSKRDETGYFDGEEGIADRWAELTAGE
mgnify:FL=1